MIRSDSRARFVIATARLLQERGFFGTNMADVVACSGAPKGSLYFHFSGGKEELVAEAVAHSAAAVRLKLVEVLAETRTLHEGLEAFVDGFAEALVQSGYRLGCPVGTVATDAPDLPIIQQSVAAAFRSWHDELRERLQRAGASAARANELAMFFLTLIEGAITVSKATQSLESFAGAKREIARVLASEPFVDRAPTGADRDGRSLI